MSTILRAPVPVAAQRQPLPLCVDLDGTLIRTDLLHEAAIGFLFRHPWSTWRLVGWAAQGPCVLKAELAKRIPLDPRTLPYRGELLDHIAAHRERGGEVHLVTASPRPWADAVATHLGIFDSVRASSATDNLKGIGKAAHLSERFGRRGFAYVGDSRHDRPVWNAAHASLGAGPAARRLLGEHAPVFADPGSAATALFRALRPHQWLKNLLVFVALFASHLAVDASALLSAGIAFLAFSLCASSAYLLNDLADLRSDRLHPRKAQRPFASGAAPLLAGVLLVPALLMGAAALCLLLPPGFAAVLGVYYATTLAYSFTLKRRALVDVFTLAGLYTLRVVAGAAAIGVAISMWLLAFSMFLFISLAMLKRYAELIDSARRGEQESRGRGYGVGDEAVIAAFGAASGFCATLVFSLYAAQPHVARLYATPALLWLVCPMLLYWLARMWLLARRGFMHDDPVVFTVRDPTGRAVIACCGVAALVAAKVALPITIFGM
jgi:4-hydroxybenzoate polyprenyltransferase